MINTYRSILTYGRNFSTSSAFFILYEFLYQSQNRIR
nr:MAG TPA: hypothetical protein [Caudoviricetes sp.]